jgi:hypothetical protein
MADDLVAQLWPELVALEETLTRLDGTTVTIARTTGQGAQTADEVAEAQRRYERRNGLL